ncbi:alpha/beta-hydrolase [Agrocybe pediades]|nr:alpha/beta-hydrolase [Agrocybe pediades]
MSSIYFPGHVAVLFRRLVNVVSTLSISHQYVAHTRSTPEDGIEAKPKHGGADGSSSSSLERVWEQWENRSRWNRGLLVDPDLREQQHQGSESVLRAAVDLPRWSFGNWSWPDLNLFSSGGQPELNLPPRDSDDDRPPPTSNNKPTSSPDSHKKQNTRHEPKPRREYHAEPTTSPPDIIHQLLVHPALFDPIRTPRYPIVLCHGLYGFDSRGPLSFPSMRMHYWSNVLSILRGKVGADVIVTSVPGTGSITQRANKLDEQLRVRAGGRGVNFLAHSMGGLDCRHLISHIQPKEYVPLSLTSISTPHRGSPFMDWCATNIGIGKLRQQEKELAERVAKDELSPASKPSSSSSTSSASSTSSFTQSLTSLPSSFTTLLLSIVDSPAYAHLTSNYLNDVFNPSTPDDPSVKYWSVAGRMSAESVSVWHPFWLPKMVLDGVEERERERLKKIWEEEHAGAMNENDTGKGNGKKKVPFWADEREWGNDGLVTVQSAKWGEFLGIMEGCDHWEMRGARGIEFGVDLPAIPALGLGTSPLASSTSNARGQAQAREPAPTARGDGWGFGDWTRFVGAWKKSREAEEKEKMGEKGKVVVRAEEKMGEKKDGREASADCPPPGVPWEASASREASFSSSSSSSTTSSSTSLSSTSSSSSHPTSPSPSSPTTPPSTPSTPSVSTLSKPQARAAQRERECLKDDAAVRNSTDTLSVVFDWLIDRVPDPRGILGKKEAEAEAVVQKAQKEMGALGAMYNTGVSSSSSRSAAGAGAPPLPSHDPPSEMKKRMEREGKVRTRKKELESKRDLERFYVALARRMYDEGL